MEIKIDMLKVVRFLKRQINSFNGQINDMVSNYNLSSYLEINDIVKDKGNNRLYVFNSIEGQNPQYPSMLCFIGNGEKLYLTKSEIDYRFTKASLADLMEVIKSGSKAPIEISHNTKYSETKADFYMITVKGDKGTVVRHETYKLAEKEAIRLAKLANHRAHIMGVVAVVDPVIKTKVSKNFNDEWL